MHINLINYVKGFEDSQRIVCLCDQSLVNFKTRLFMGNHIFMIDDYVNEILMG